MKSFSVKNYDLMVITLSIPDCSVKRPTEFKINVFKINYTKNYIQCMYIVLYNNRLRENVQSFKLKLLIRVTSNRCVLNEMF